MRLSLTAAFVALGTALPVQALDLGNLADTERDALRAEIRAYLLENPEVIMEAVAVLEERQAAGEAAADVELVRANADALFHAPGDWVGGNPEGDITLVEFMDYRCSFCRRAHGEVAGLLAADGNIRFVLKEFPILGEESVAASRFAIATKRVAGDEAYKSVHDALMSYTGAMNAAGFTRLADALGLDANAIVAEMEADAVTEIIAANHALAQRLRVNGTPAFVMDEHMLRGYMPQDQMQAIADEIRTN
ncbi:MAG: disulfide bond formation protein DsbA [Alphaproteobacteria bacterium HGW-Alphaproteobacteria-1]|jgi:protein-disulfide isomerase|nr:MAG: disulfide bond formation protein DsbA [Alphaproteobacteria bacterium HGW-Alphaproteobacteria-1]